MMNSFARKVTFLMAVVGLGLCPSARADSVAMGSAYIQTQPFVVNYGGVIGNVTLVGLPIGPGTTDTIIQGLTDATINGAAVPIQLTAFSLQSAAPVNIGGSFFDVFVTLDPANLNNDTGTVSFMGSLAGGTFNQTLTYDLVSHFTLVGGGFSFDVFSSTVNNFAGAWSPNPAPGAILVTGADCDSACSAAQIAADQAANTHTGLAVGEVDAYGPQQAVPEPSSMLLLGIGLARFSHQE